MSAIDDLFRDLRAAGRKAFMPFVTAGDPDLGFTADVLRLFAARGCHLCELGIPYSDPIADGPVIQASYTRALASKIKLAEIFAMLRGVAPLPVGRPFRAVEEEDTAQKGRPTHESQMPVVTMVSYAIIHRHGLERFVAEAMAAGAEGAIVPDLLVEESADLAAICRREDFSLVQLVTPTTPRERALRIAEASTGFIYYVSVTGITGEREALPQPLIDSVSWLRERTELPICIGFGISRPEHIKTLAPVADGLIVGSAIVRRMEQAATRPREDVLREIGEYVDTLLGALG
jgi:tryptophan synthase alpha chain